MATKLLHTPLWAFQSGAYAPAAKAYFFLSGTTTPVTVYSDAAESVAHSQPVLADSEGMFPAVFYSGASEIKCVIQDTDGVQIDAVDPVGKVTSDTSAASTVSFTPVTGNTATNVQDAIENHNDDLTNIRAIGSASTGMVAKTGAATYSARTVTAGNGIAVTNGDGVSGNPTVAADFASTAEAEAGTSTTDVMNPAGVAAYVAAQGFAWTETSVVDLTNSAANDLTEYDFTGLPSGLTEVELHLYRASLTGTDHLEVQLSTGSTFVTAGYNAGSGYSTATASATDAFPIRAASATSALSGIMRLYKRPGANRWIASIAMGGATSVFYVAGGGDVSLGGALDGLKIQSSGTDTFDGSSECWLRYR